MTKEIPSVYVGRHPIYDRKLNVVAYELLYRSSHQNFADISDGNKATSELLTAAFMSIGIEKIVGQKKAFVNLTREFLIGDFLLPLNQDQIVLEILEDIAVDDEVVAAMHRLRDDGYTLALDDFVLENNQLPLVELAHLVKIDIAVLSRDELVAHVDLLRTKNVRLLAEKVETREELDLCMELDFDYFQGYFFCKPNIVSGDRIPENRAAVLGLLGAVYMPNVEIAALVDRISQDVTISYKLLRFINSAYFGVRAPIGSIKQASVRLGLEPLKKWVAMIALSTTNTALPEVIVMALVRARMCELLAEASGESNHSESFFTVGLFSMLEQMMDTPLDEILSQLPLDDEVIVALTKMEGRRGGILNTVIDYEQQVCTTGAVCGFTQEQLTDSYVESVAWADSIVVSLA